MTSRPRSRLRSDATSRSQPGSIHSLLGGLIVKVGSRMMDNSLKTKLQNLKIAMKGTA